MILEYNYQYIYIFLNSNHNYLNKHFQGNISLQQISELIGKRVKRKPRYITPMHSHIRVKDILITVSTVYKESKDITQIWIEKHHKDITNQYKL